MRDAPQTDASSWWAPWALPIIGEPIRNARLTFADGRIVSVEPGVAREDVTDTDCLIFDECVLTPGFVNPHSHIEYAAYDGIADGLPFELWIADHMHRKRRLEPHHVRASAELGAWQSLASGITFVADASFSGDAAHALNSVGIRGRIYLEAFGGGEGSAQRVLDSTQTRIAELPKSDIVEYGISPHAPYTVFPDLYRTIAESGAYWTTHVAESHAEMRFLETGDGPIVDAFKAKGIPIPVWNNAPIIELRDVIDQRALFVHGVHLRDSDIEVLASTGAALVHCPRSNARLGCGVPDLQRLERAGVIVALGTDSPASAGPIDMFAEMRSALELNRAMLADATTLSLAEVLRMATVTAAQALGFNDLGVLLAGAHADVVATRIGNTKQPLNRFILGATPADVQAVAVAGRILWRHDMDALAQAFSAAEDARTLLELPVPTQIRT